ncbi:hypothetical protein BaRGS_00029807 [Batillaria attramentaria]|uniref:Uncharacterized protein n=1 Tax=Batillaria attramentaria TaxID=370345 RepID=A0ABD0JV09_9CAEN
MQHIVESPVHLQPCSEKDLPSLSSPGDVDRQPESSLRLPLRQLLIVAMLRPFHPTSPRRRPLVCGGPAPGADSKNTGDKRSILEELLRSAEHPFFSIGHRAGLWLATRV